MFNIYQIANIDPSCKIPPKLLDFSVSSAFSGTEEALNLKPLNLGFGYGNKTEEREEKRDELLWHERPLVEVKRWSWTGTTPGLGLGFRLRRFFGFRNGAEGERANAVICILWACRERKISDTERERFNVAWRQ